MPRKTTSYFFSRTSFKFPSTNQSIAFHLKQTVLSKKSRKLSSTSQLERWLTKRDKSYSVELSWYSKSTFAKTTLLNSSIQVRTDGDIFWIFLPYDKFWLRLLDSNFDKLNMEKGSIIVVSMSTFKLINLYSNQLEIFRQAHNRDAFGQISLMFKNDLLFVRLILYFLFMKLSMKRWLNCRNVNIPIKKCFEVTAARKPKTAGSKPAILNIF